jgi:hypothetical protein
MSASHLMSSTAQLLTPEDRVLLAEIAAADLPLTLLNQIVLVQSNSLELVKGDAKEFPGVAVGDYLVPHDSERLLYRGPVGYPCQVLSAEVTFPEFLPGRGGFVAPHDEKPETARWLKVDESPDAKAGFYDSVTGNRYEETLLVTELVDGKYVAVQIFRSTGLAIGRDMLNRAFRRIDGEPDGCVLRKFQMGSRPEKRNDFRWQVPAPTYLGVFGSKAGGGPTIEEVRLAAKLRKSLKQGLPWSEPPEPPAVEAQAPLPTLEPPARRPTVVVSSGRQTCAFPAERDEPPPHTSAPNGPGEDDLPII